MNYTEAFEEEEVKELALSVGINLPNLTEEERTLYYSIFFVNSCPNLTKLELLEALEETEAQLVEEYFDEDETDEIFLSRALYLKEVSECIKEKFIHIP